MSYRLQIPNLRKAQEVADRFNTSHPVGTRVRYWRGLRLSDPSGEGVTVSDAQVLGAAPVVWISGCSGCVALSHVEVIS